MTKSIVKASLISATCLTLFSVTGGALAQGTATTTGSDPAITPDTTQVANASVDDFNTIIVTGSRIAPGTQTPIPITSVSADDLTRTGSVSIGDRLNDLPQLRSTVSQANSTAGIGTSGLNILDLRGLGTARTLVLVNGRRHITSVEGEFAVDVNTIPTELIDRTDIVTGGSSAVYGSDAMAGVVNFVLKRNYEGVSINAQGGLNLSGDRGTYRLAATAGKNFADGRGNVAVSLEYDQANPLFFTDRDSVTGAFSGRNQFQLVDNPALDNTIPNRTFLHGVRSFGYSDGGSFISYGGTNLRRCPVGVPAACRPNGVPRVFLFQPDGSLKESVYGTDFRPVGSGNNQGGDGSTLNNTGVLDPGYKRYIANLIAHYDVSDAFRPFIEAKFVRVDSFQVDSPSFSQGGFQGDDQPEFGQINTPISLDNAFLTPAQRTLIQSLLPAGATYFNLNRNNIDLGSRGEQDRRDTYRIVAGVEGTFNEDWHYDVSANYGHLRTRYRFLHNRIDQNFYNAVDSVAGPNGPVCRINVDADPTNNDPACVPANLLGQGRISQAAINYFDVTSLRRGRASELDFNANLIGDSSQLFSLPGGPVRFAIGGEYRRERASYEYDDLVTSGATFLNAIQPFNPPSFVVKEAYGELQAPILSDVRFASELSINGAGRVAHYKGSVGTVYAYNYGGVYAPIRDIRFRANISKSVRAPTLADLYAPNSQNFGLVDDPCDVNFINTGKATRPANCAAAGVPVGFENAQTRAASLQFLSGGNPNLREETSKSYTYGVVLQPRFIPGLSISVDYYNIKIANVISPVDEQTILDGCYDGASLNNSFCQLINPRDPVTSYFGAPALLQSSLNFAAERARGIDVDVNYRHRFDADNTVKLRFIGNYVRERTDFPYISDPTRPERIKGELGDPIYQFNVDIDYTYKKFNIGYEMRFIGRQSITDWEAQHTTFGNEPQDPFYADRIYYPRVIYHSIRANLDVTDKFSFYGGVDNLTNRRPPYGLLGTGDGDGIYDNVGRFMYVGVRAKL